MSWDLILYIKQSGADMKIYKLHENIWEFRDQLSSGDESFKKKKNRVTIGIGYYW